MISLRPYQSEITDAIRSAYASGKRAPMVCLSTGGGKTTIFSYIAKNATAKNKTVFLLCHRAELTKQIAGTLARFGTHHQIIAPGPIVRQCQVEQFKGLGRSFVSGTAGAYVASVQTLIKRLDKYPNPDLIIVDEAHHLTEQSTWGRIVAAYPDAKILPVSATPCRLDGRGLGVGHGGFADDLINGPTMRELIDAGYLSPYRIFAPPTELDLSHVKKRMGDFAKDQLTEAMDKPVITGSAVEHYKKLTAGKRAIVFCVSVAHAEHVAAEFNAAGVVAESLDGTIDALERDARIKRFSDGKTLVLTSCEIVSEGFDLPAIEVAILLRPTASLALYLQQVGRALRVFEGKTEAIILDHVGNVLRHGLPDEEREWTLEGVTRRAKSKQDEEPDVKISTCDKCYAIHEPAPVCPVCGFVYPVKERKLEQTEGELKEIGADELEAMRRKQRALQGQAQSVEQMVAQGISRPRAVKILQAREVKNGLIGDVVALLDEHRKRTGMEVFRRSALRWVTFGR